ncbi:Cathepsin L precursor, putative [Pediculus humanus corporis]|uniref:Cathepsin L, putative n=1 Tax=Pediculus humanus subsp. corporis TaxID=121224 RepID=E0VWY5_PEDHC|nr:Cathepsin L precursor, putative [Pediculus humanus corporis]EEB17891.1 Cathepsin L precursor, putative [Pediculus humanus corporis]
MKFLFVVGVFLLATVAVGATNSYENVIQKEWDLFKAQYGKSYKTPEEEYYRMRIYMDNKLEIVEHNLKFLEGKVSYEMGENQFSDMTSDEVNDLYNGYNKINRMNAKPGEIPALPEMDGVPFVAKNEDVPDYVNWVEAGAVTPIRDQGACGSCYAFASLATLESRLMIYNKTELQLSVQNVLDCSGEFGNFGCDGGLARNVYEYVMDNEGVNNETDYPYEVREGKCRFSSKKFTAKIKDYVSVSYFDEDALKAAVATGPVSVSMDASSPAFKKYKGGVYTDDKCSSMKLNHAVVAVGYGTDPDTKQDYWLVRNSWGTAWGERGYFKIARNADNMCGLATRPVFPTL